jgi:hypothetical protein
LPILTTAASPPSALTPSAAFEARMVLLLFLRGLAAKIKTRLGRTGVMLKSHVCGIFQFCVKTVNNKGSHILSLMLQALRATSNHKHD